MKASVMKNIPRAGGAVWRTLSLSVLLVMSSCATEENKAMRISEPMKIIKDRTASDSVTITSGGSGSRRERLAAEPGPAIPAGRAGSEPLLSSTPPRLTGEAVTIKFEGIRLPAFINTVFGEILKVPYEIDNALMQKDVMVTLSTGDAPLPRDAFYQLIGEVLSNYGVGIIYSNNIYRIVESTSVKRPIPRIIRSRANAQVPVDIRPIFLFQPVNAVPIQTMTIWLDLALKDRVQAVPLPYANGLLLLGKSEDVTAAVEIIQTLDQPYMAGARSLRISPAFWSAQKLSAQLVDIMVAEGYSIAIGGATNAAVKLIPIEALNVIIAFGTGQEVLQHLLQWATDLDQPGQTVAAQGAFYHQVYNAKAKDLADIVKGMVETSTTTSADQRMATGTGVGATAGGTTTTTTLSKQRIMVDEARNGIIFVGLAEEYAQFRSLMVNLDRAPYEVMIEATIAEVTLREGENLGLVFDFDDKRADGPNRTSVRSSAGGIVFSLIRDHATIMSTINALAEYNRLQILSSPRLVTSSGKAAAISVGTQVPIITSQETASGQVQGNTSILQAIQYRNTGVILNIAPTINSSRRVELTVSQEVSDAQQNSVSGVQSPLIVQRSISTTLSLDDGETALLGGMIRENYSSGNTGIPYLKDIPWIGNLFKTSSKSINRTELIILLTPYIIDNSDTARQIRDSFRNQLGEWARPEAQAKPGIVPVAAPSAAP